MGSVGKAVSGQSSCFLRLAQGLVECAAGVEAACEKPVAEGITWIEFDRSTACLYRTIVSAGFHVNESDERIHDQRKRVEIASHQHLGNGLFIPVQHA